MFFLSLMIFLSSCSFMTEKSHSEQQRKKELYKDTVMSSNVDTAIFASGCFWCTEAMFEELKGVQSVESGYSRRHGCKPILRTGLHGNYRARGINTDYL